MRLFGKLNMSATTFASALMLTLSAVPAHAGWQLTLGDEFDGTALNTQIWKYSDYFGLETNVFEGDQQCYRPANVTVGNGVVTLQARQEFPPGCNPDPGTLMYTSGQISTGFNFSQQYGYFEVRAKLPKGVGLESMFRLAVAGGSFPPQPPQINVMQVDGANTMNTNLQYHYLMNGTPQVEAFNYGGVDLSPDFHTFGIDWQPGVLVWYVDGIERARLEDAAVANEFLYPILQLAVGNNRTGSPDGTTVLPADMQVDYIRVYQRVADGQPDALPPGAVNPDSESPVVTLKAPLLTGDNQNFNVSATATDNTGVNRVEFSLNGQLICTRTAAPYECVMLAPKLNRGELLRKVKVSVTAFDSAGNQTTKARNLWIFNSRR